MSSVVLVPKRDSWRECANLVQANGRIKHAVHPVPDCATVLQQLTGSIMTTLDITSGFHNIPIPKHLQQFCGLVTHEGIYVS